MKSTCLGAEPIGFKGGALQRLPKPSGDRTSCSAQRGILLQPAISKALHKSARKLVMKAYEEDALDFQIGGRKQFSAVFGSLATRSLIRLARRENKSCSIVYLDLAAAYYAIVRELIFGWSADTKLEEITQSLQLEPEDLQELATLVRDEPILRGDVGRDALHRLGREIHNQTWFIMKDDKHVVATRRGTRPGSSWADSIFNILFAKVVRRKRRSATCYYAPVISWDGKRSLDTMVSSGDGTLRRTIELPEIIFADDLAACSMTDEVARIERATIDTACGLITTFSHHGMRANFGRAKTACSITVNGRGCREIRQRLFVQMRGRLPLLMEHMSTWVDIVPQYKHLGSVVCQSGSLRAEISMRLNIARANMKQGKRFIFGNRSISFRKRVVLFRSHVLASLLHGAGSWHVLNEGEFQLFAGGVMALFRQVLAIHAGADQRWSREQILGAVGLPGPQALLHIERLRFLRLLVQKGPDSLWAILRNDEGFQCGMRAALAWMFGRVRNTIPLQDPEEHWEDWCGLMTQKPGMWKGWIKRAAATEAVLQQLAALMDVTIRQIWPQHAVRPGSMEDGMHACIKCRLAFASRQQWGAHASRSHGYKARHTRLSRGRRCQACGATYATARRLQRHLQTSPNCLRAYNLGMIDNVVDDSEGHVQAPPRYSGARPCFDDAPPAICEELLSALQADHPHSETALMAIVQEYFAPFEEIRNTVARWMECATGEAQIMAAEVLERFTPAEMGCSAHTGSVGKKRDEPYRPCLTPFPSQAEHDLRGLFAIGVPEASWLERFGQCDTPPQSASFWTADALDNPGFAAIWIQCPDPPSPCSTLLSPTSSSLKLCDDMPPGRPAYADISLRRASRPGSAQRSESYFKGSRASNWSRCSGISSNVGQLLAPVPGCLSVSPRI